MTTFYNFKMAWGGARDTGTENTTDNCWLNVCQDMGRRKMCPWQLKRFWIEHDLFWQFYINDFFRGQTRAHTLEDKNIFFKGTWVKNKRGIEDEKNNLVTSDVLSGGWPGPTRVSCDAYTCILIISLMKNSSNTTPLFSTLPEVQCRPIRSLSWSIYTHTWPHRLKAIKYYCNILYYYSLLLEASLSLS